MIRRPPESKRTATLFPDTTLFRSDDADRIAVVEWHEDFRLGGGQAHVMLGKMSAASAEQATPDQPWRAPQHAGKQPRMHPRDTQIVAPDIEMRDAIAGISDRSEEHTSELQSLMRISYAVFCLKKKNKQTTYNRREH